MQVLSKLDLFSELRCKYTLNPDSHTKKAPAISIWGTRVELRYLSGQGFKHEDFTVPSQTSSSFPHVQETSAMLYDGSSGLTTIRPKSIWFHRRQPACRPSKGWKSELCKRQLQEACWITWVLNPLINGIQSKVCHLRPSAYARC